MKLDQNVKLLQDSIGGDPALQRLVYHLQRYLESVALQVNQLSEGDIQARYNATDLAPSGAGKNGDIVWRKTVSEAGTTPNKYVHVGHICVVSGNPATWVPIRWPTGN